MIDDAGLDGFRTMHAAFRTEYGRLAEAFRAPRDEGHRRLLEEHLALTLDILHAHHTHEDEHLWPFLVRVSPASKPELDSLEAEHQELDPLVTASADTSRSTAERADSLQALHAFLNSHIDHEEAVAFPLMRHFLTDQDLDDDRRKAVREIGRRRMPVVVGWIASCLDERLLAASLGEQPRVVRLLFRRFWWPAYERRFTALYGSDARVVAGSLAGAR
ncbi:MAG: hemerythrin domain-containing protein [Marmoricola sp.]|nr:hemerythrin domain-containing protein [Marmoricola sp.]